MVVLEYDQMETASTSTYAFESQTSDEKVVFILRAHPVTNLPWVLVAILLVLVPPILAATNLLEGFSNNGIRLSAQNLEGFVLIWYLVVFAFILQSFLHWYFNIYILTDRRIVDIDFFQLLYKRVSSAQLTNIEDITASTGGVFQVLFHYGDVHIQTAGTNVNFEFLKVPNPGEVKRQIDQQIHKLKL